MIKMYQNVSSASTRQARKFFQDNNMEVEVVKLSRETLSYKDFLKILSLTDNGVSDIISERSNAFREIAYVKGIKVDDLKLSELYELVVEDVSLLRTPITVCFENTGRLVVGSDVDRLIKFEKPEDKVTRREKLYDSLEDDLLID